MKRVTRERRLTSEEAQKYQAIRDQVAQELPDLIARHQERLGDSDQPKITIPSVIVKYAHNGSSTRANAMGMRPMQERVWQKRGEQYLLIKSPPASGKSRALMFVALDKLANQKIKQAIIVVPERSIGASFHDEPLSHFGFF